jgi:hypothetical protein
VPATTPYFPFYYAYLMISVKKQKGFWINPFLCQTMCLSNGLRNLFCFFSSVFCKINNNQILLCIVKRQTGDALIVLEKSQYHKNSKGNWQNVIGFQIRIVEIQRNA